MNCLKIVLCMSLIYVGISNINGMKPIPDNEINFSIKYDKDPLLKYKYVLIAFDRIERSRSTKEERTKFILNEPSEEEIMKKNDFEKLVKIAEKLLTRYREPLSKKIDYYTKAYNYRILQWLKFSMRKDNVSNETLEETIENLLQQKQTDLFDPLYPLDLQKSRYSSSVLYFADIVSYERNIQENCAKINTFDELREFGLLQDGIVGFCILLGLKKEEIAENEKIEMPFYKQIDQYEELLHKASTYSSDFKSTFGADFSKVLEYLYYALSVRLRIEYPHVQIEHINLKQSSNEKIKYFCELMRLYFNALKRLMKETYNLQLDVESVPSIAEKNPRIENFYIDMEKIDELRSNTSEAYVTEDTKLSVLMDIAFEVLSSYNELITKLFNTSFSFRMSCSFDFIQNYSRLIGWLAAHLKKLDKIKNPIYRECEKQMNQIKSLVKQKNEGQLKGKIKDNHSQSTEWNLESKLLSEDQYLELTTYDSLISAISSG